MESLTRIIIYLFPLIGPALFAAYQDDIGLYELRAREASLTGAGVEVGQVEAEFSGNWQTDPANVGLVSTIFTYYDTTTAYPLGASYNSSLESGHANTVGGRFFAVPSGTDGKDGVAPGVSAIDVFNANYFYNTLMVLGTNVNLPVINQSFVFNDTISGVDQNYDNYAANFNTLFINGINTNVSPSTIPSPASSYNGIAVGAVDRAVTPLSDNRSKPDIVAPGSTASSFTTPLVAGAAAILVQSALLEDAGSDTASDASDMRTIKSLLLNSATKPSGWSHTSTRPLDTINGAGILEVNRAQLQLASGQYSETVNDTLTSSGASHLPPTGITDNVGFRTGWNLSTVTNQRVTGQWRDATDHYFFECSSSDASTFNLTATLVWNRNPNRANINNLDLFLYREDGTFIASSVSTVDNVEHLYELDLPPGRYVLQVYKPEDGRDSTSETYALAFNFEAGIPAPPDSAAASAVSTSAIDLSWTDNSSNEDGFRIERRLSGGTYSEIDTVAANTTSYSDTALTDGTTYEYHITAFNSSGSSAGATAGATTAIAAPSGGATTTISATEIQISWNDNSTSEDGYRIERRPSGGSYAELTTVAPNTVFYDDSGLTAGAAYDYRITAFNTTGDSASIETSGSTYTEIENWRLTFFSTTTNSGDAADDNDFDLDSIDNLIEFATGSDPTVFSPNPLDTSALGTDGRISFNWRVDTTNDFSLGYSNDLNAGFTYYDSSTLDSGSSPKLELIGTSDPVDGFETRTYGVRDSVTDPNVFLRLLVN